MRYKRSQRGAADKQDMCRNQYQKSITETQITLAQVAAICETVGHDMKPTTRTHNTTITYE